MGNFESSCKVDVHLMASEASWMEQSAIDQLNQTALWPGMVKAVGLPDLHPGKYHPIGAAFITRGILYPQLVGNDIGCGMGLWQSDLLTKKNQTIKLPSKDYIQSLENFIFLKDQANFEKYKIFDYRINQQLILK